MSKERETVVVGSSTTVTTNEEMKESRAERKARLARVLERGIVADRLVVDLPPDLHGEWVADDPVEIARMQAMGFRVDTEFAPSKSLHSTGAKEGRVGDVIHMICEKETKEIIDEIRREQFQRAHGKPGKSSFKEEKEGASLIEKEGLATFTESKEHVARKADIEAALADNVPTSKVLTEKI